MFHHHKCLIEMPKHNVEFHGKMHHGLQQSLYSNSAMTSDRATWAATGVIRRWISAVNCSRNWLKDQLALSPAIKSAITCNLGELIRSIVRLFPVPYQDFLTIWTAPLREGQGNPLIPRYAQKEWHFLGNAINAFISVMLRILSEVALSLPSFPCHTSKQKEQFAAAGNVKIFWASRL